MPENDKSIDNKNYPENDNPQLPNENSVIDSNQFDEKTTFVNKNRSWRRFFRRKGNKKSKFFIWFLRCFVWLPISIISALILSLLLLDYFLNADRVRTSLIQILEDQTGSKIEIEDLEFDLLTGFTIDRIRFYPPNSLDLCGYKNGGEINSTPLIEIEQLVANYNLSGLLAGRVNIDAIKIIRPSAYLIQNDGVFNFQSIIDYRSKNYPAQVSDEISQPVSQESGGIPNDFVIKPAFFFMPVDILIQEIGVFDAKIQVNKFEKGRETQKIELKGMSVETAIKWYKRDSLIALSIYSDPNKSLQILFEQYPQNKSVDDQNSRDYLQLNAGFIAKAEISNLEQLSIQLASKISSISTQKQSLNNLKSDLNIRIKAEDGYKSFTIHELRTSIADILNYNLEGVVKLHNYTADAMDLNIKQNVQLSLDAAAKITRMFSDRLDFGGELAVNNIDISGQIKPKMLVADLPNFSKNDALPSVSAELQFNEIWAKYPSLGIEIAPLSSRSFVSLSRAIDSDGIQIDLKHDLHMPSTKISGQSKAIGKYASSIDDLRMKVFAKAVYPQLIAPLFKLDLEAKHVRAKGDKINQVDMPLVLHIDAAGSADLNRVAGDISLELGKILKFTTKSGCDNRCQNIRSTTNIQVKSLGDIHSAVLPLGAALGVSDVFPGELRGSAELEFDVQGHVPDPFSTPINDIVRHANMRWRIASDLERVHVKIPKFDLLVSDFNSRMIGEGSTKDQRLDFSQRFGKLEISLPVRNTSNEKPDKLIVSGYNFDTRVDNKIDGYIDISNVKQIADKTSTSVSAKLNIARVSGFDDLLQKPVNNIQFRFDMSQKALSDIQLRTVNFLIPDFGISIDVMADTKLTKELLPERFSLKLKNELSFTGNEPIPMGIKATGSMALTLGISADDVAIDKRRSDNATDFVEKLLLKVDGAAKFKEFSLNVPNTKEFGKSNLLNVERLNGDVPFNQNLDVPALIKSISAIKKKQTDLINQKNIAANTESPSAVGLEAIGDDLLEDKIQKFIAKNQNASLKNANMTAMVDFGAVRPFFPDRKPITIKKIEAANLEITDLEVDLEIKQNWIALNQYAMNFLGGKIRGDLQFGFDPVPRFFQTNLQMTKLDTRKLLDKFPSLKNKSRSTFDFVKSDPEIDGTFRFSYDIDSTDMNGGLEITKIGKEQVNMILYFIDPYEQNDSIADLRKALLLGEPSRVSVPVKSSRVGFEVEVRSPLTLGRPIPGLPRFRDIPINQVVDSAIAKLVDDVRMSDSAIEEEDEEADINIERTEDATYVE